MKILNKKIIIVNSYVNYGGPIVLAELCRNLRKLGCDARLLMVPYFARQKVNNSRYKKYIVVFQLIALYNYILFKITGKERKDRYGIPFFFSLVKGCKLQYHPFFNKSNSIVIYPEVVFGNPLDADNVVRWLLYNTKYKNLPGAYLKTDIFIAYREIFNDLSLNPNNYIIRQIYFDLDLYKRYNYGGRQGKCYIIRKGAKRPDLPISFDGPIIDKLPEKEKVRIFNESEYCYCYDTQTAYSSIAAICGCKSIIIPEPGKSRKDYRGNENNPGYGIAYGDKKEEIEWALSTVDKLVESLDHTELNIKNAMDLINILKKHFN
jgi:hypothetical protein